MFNKVIKSLFGLGIIFYSFESFSVNNVEYLKKLAIINCSYMMHPDCKEYNFPSESECVDSLTTPTVDLIDKKANFSDIKANECYKKFQDTEKDFTPSQCLKRFGKNLTYNDCKPKPIVSPIPAF